MRAIPLACADGGGGGGPSSSDVYDEALSCSSPAGAPTETASGPSVSASDAAVGSDTCQTPTQDYYDPASSWNREVCTPGEPASAQPAAQQPSQSTLSSSGGDAGVGRGDAGVGGGTPGGSGSVQTAEAFDTIASTVPESGQGAIRHDATKENIWEVDKSGDRQLVNITNVRTGVVDSKWDASAFPDELLPRDVAPRKSARPESAEPDAVKKAETKTTKETSRRDEPPEPPGEQLDEKTDRSQREIRDQSEQHVPELPRELYGPTQRERALKDLSNLTAGARPLLEVAPELNRGGTLPIFVVENQKIFGFKPNGDLHGNVEGYWEGSSGTNRPATNLKPGTYVVDRETLKVYSAPTGDVVGRVMRRGGATASDVISRGGLGVFLQSVWRSPHRTLAFQEATDGQQVIVIRVPREGDLAPADRDQEAKVKEALHRAGRYTGPETARALEALVRNPELLVLTVSGTAGLYLFGSQFAKNAGTATAMARSAQTSDAIDAAARIYARGFGDIAALLGVAAVGKGAAAGVKAMRSAAGAGLEARAGGGQPMAPRKGSEPTTDIARADTVRENIGEAKTVRMRADAVPERTADPKFEYLTRTYYEGDSAQATRSLQNVWEGDIDAALKSCEFRQRFHNYLKEHGGPMPAETIREIVREVDGWHDRQFGGQARSSAGAGEMGAGSEGVLDRELGRRIGEFDRLIAQERTRVAELHASMSPKDWNKARAGETKRLYNLLETRHAYETQRIHQDRTVYEQVEIVGIRTPDGALNPIEGCGRIADWAELRGNSVQLGDIKSPSALRGSVRGGVRQGPVDAVFRDSAAIARQRAAEQQIVQSARDLDGRIVFEGTNVITRGKVRFECTPADVRPSRVTTYRSAGDN